MSAFGALVGLRSGQAGPGALPPVQKAGILNHPRGILPR